MRGAVVRVTTFPNFLAVGIMAFLGGRALEMGVVKRIISKIAMNVGGGAQTARGRLFLK